MTVSYAGDNLSNRLLLRWRGSVWKTLLVELLVYLFLYCCISITYRFAMNTTQRETFENVAIICREHMKSVPLTFIVGFYVAIAVKRWWEQLSNIPRPEDVMLWVSAYIHGTDERSCMLRRQVARYLILTATLALRQVSARVYRRFPTFDHIQAAGLITRSEREVFGNVKLKFHVHRQWFLPLNWILSIFMHRAYLEKLLSSMELKMLIKVVESYRNAYGTMFMYDWVTVPLVYTQVGTITTYGFFFLSLAGSQYLSSSPRKTNQDNEVDLYVPFFCLLQFVFYVGWLKVGEELMHPFGDDDEDFELNYLLDRHTELAFFISDVHGQLPPYEPTIFDTAGYTFPGFPHTRASEKCVERPPRCHFESITLSRQEQLHATATSGATGSTEKSVNVEPQDRRAKLTDGRLEREKRTQSPLFAHVQGPSPPLSAYIPGSN